MAEEPNNLIKIELHPMIADSLERSLRRLVSMCSGAVTPLIESGNYLQVNELLGDIVAVNNLMRSLRESVVNYENSKKDEKNAG